MSWGLTSGTSAKGCFHSFLKRALTATEPLLPHPLPLLTRTHTNTHILPASVRWHQSSLRGSMLRVQRHPIVVIFGACSTRRPRQRLDVSGGDFGRPRELASSDNRYSGGRNPFNEGQHCPVTSTSRLASAVFSGADVWAPTDRNSDLLVLTHGRCSATLSVAGLCALRCVLRRCR